MASKQKLQRIIEAAIFKGEIGPVTARELVAMPQAEWGTLRDRITDHRHKRSSGLLAECAMCGDPVFIRARKKNGVAYPLFSHFQGGGLACPWRHGVNENPDTVRRDQYHGQQESQAHRLLCEQIDALAKLDERYISSAVNAYRPPTESEHGRYPDVAIIWRDFPECVFEVQLSRTFQTEISARCTHYEREHAALIWVLFGFDPQQAEIPPSFTDVIRRHRGNAFILDREAVTASREQHTIVLKTYLQNASGGFDPPQLVRLDALTFPKGGLPYLDDRISKALLDRIARHRRKCFAFLKTIRGVSHGVERDSTERRTLLEELRAIEHPFTYWEASPLDADNAILRLIACVFSVIAAANGKPRIYGTSHLNITGMLNTWLHTRDDIQRSALILERLLTHTPLANLLEGTVGEHIARAKAIMDGNLVLEQEPEWEIVGYLVPEIFDPRIREQLRYLGSLPKWAQSAARPTERAINE